MMATLRVQVSLRDHARPVSCSRANSPSQDDRLRLHQTVLGPVGKQLAHSRGVVGRCPRALEPGLDRQAPAHDLEHVDLEPGTGEERAPLVLAVAADVARVVEPLGLLDPLVLKEVVLDDDAVTADPGHLAHGQLDIVEVMGGDPADRHVETPVREGNVFPPRHDIGLHPRRRIERDDVGAGLAQPARDVAAAGRDVDRGHVLARLAELDDAVEVSALAMRRALAHGLRSLRPGIRHAASSTTRRAASSIVGSTWRFAEPASASSCRPSSAFVPSRRTTIGSSIAIWSSAWRMPRATSSQRVMPPKMLKKIAFTWGSALMISSASTTPCASPPPPRSQKFAGRPPASPITSSVDITRPAPLPRIPTSPSSFTYVTPISRAARSSGG